MSTELCYILATEALKLFRRRKLSPVELLEAQIARAEAVEPKINAFTDTYYKEALAKARKAEAKYMKRSARPRPGYAAPSNGLKSETNACLSRAAICHQGGHRFARCLL